MTDNDGWIEWGGGAPPVAAGAVVHVRHRDGEEHTYQRSECPIEWVGDKFVSAAYTWDHADDAGDIIAYKVIEP